MAAGAVSTCQALALAHALDLSDRSRLLERLHVLPAAGPACSRSARSCRSASSDGPDVDRGSRARCPAGRAERRRDRLPRKKARHGAERPEARVGRQRRQTDPVSTHRPPPSQVQHLASSPKRVVAAGFSSRRRHRRSRRWSFQPSIHGSPARLTALSPCFGDDRLPGCETMQPKKAQTNKFRS